MKDSIREAGKVSLELYYWTYADYRNLLGLASWFPMKGKFTWTSTYALYYLGTFSFIFIIIGLPVAVYDRKSRKLVMLLGLVIIFTGLLSLGPDGYLGHVFYYIPPYNFFRHSAKWLTIYQISYIILSYYIAHILFQKFLRQRFQEATYFSVFVVQILIYSYYIYNYDNAGSQRFTQVSLPLEFKGKDYLDDKYRSVGIWHQGELYTTTNPESLLGHNYASFYKIPTIAGYEPIMLKKNFQIVAGNWLSGFYTDANSFPLEPFTRYGLKYLITLGFQTKEIIEILNKNYPAITILPLKSFKDSNNQKFDILLIKNTHGIVQSSKRNTLEFSIRGNSVYVPVQKGDSRITLAWVANRHFKTFLNGIEIPWIEDSDARIIVDLSSYQEGLLELRYYPEEFYRILTICIGIFISSCLIWLVMLNVNYRTQAIFSSKNRIRKCRTQKMG